MYMDSASTIGEKINIRMGRTIETLNNAVGVSGDFSFDVRFVLPVAFRSFAALRSRTTGAYVSLRKKKAEIEITPP